MVSFLIAISLLYLFGRVQAVKGNSNETHGELYYKIENELDPNDYGVDVSTAVQHLIDRNSFQGKRYYDNVQGCYDRYNKEDCDAYELSRLTENLAQPAKHVNYTKIGFKKWKVPKAAWEPLKAFWEANKHEAKSEEFTVGDALINHWNRPSSMVSLENGALRGSGHTIKKTIWSSLRPLVEEWVGGHKLTEVSLYGIRVYHEGATLGTHVDTIPLVTSCIINVDQDVNEPWPIEVYGHDGKAYNVTMEPGDMVFYESHTVLHGRPFPLNGSFYANLFVHYIPIGHKERNHAHFQPASEEGHEHEQSGESSYYQASETKEESDSHSSSHEESSAQDITTHYYYGRTVDPSEHVEEDQIGLHAAAARGDYELVESILNVSEDKAVVNKKDDNEWQPIHEAVRAGHTDIVKLLVQNGAELHHKTYNGGTPLWWARRELHEDHSMIAFLEEIGAPEEGNYEDL